MTTDRHRLLDALKVRRRQLRDRLHDDAEQLLVRHRVVRTVRLLYRYVQVHPGLKRPKFKRGARLPRPRVDRILRGLL